MDGRGTTRVTLIGSGAGIGGTERHLASLLRGLPGRGFEVELVTSERGSLTDLAAACGVASTVVARNGALPYLLRLSSHLKKTHPQVVHAHAGRLPCLAARQAGIRWILDTRHGHLDPRLGPDEEVGPNDGPAPRFGARARWRLEGLKGRLAHLTLTVCERDRELLLCHGGLSAGRVRTVYNGLPPTDRSRPARAGSTPPEQRFVLGWVGRMAEQKAPLRVLELFSFLLREGAAGSCLGTGLVLEMHGDGPLRPQLEARARELGLTERVVFPGVGFDGARDMTRFDVLLLPSRKEGLPYVLLEALGAGTPVLATPVGGMPEVLTGELSRGVAPWDLQVWGDRLRDLLEDRDLWSRLSEAARRRARDFPESRMLDEIALIYEQSPERVPDSGTGC